MAKKVRGKGNTGEGNEKTGVRARHGEREREREREKEASHGCWDPLVRERAPAKEKGGKIN